MQFKFIGHACVLVSCDGYNLITDPWFGFDFHFGTFHSYPPIIPPPDEALKKIDAIHISHIHQDHLCTKSLALFPKNVMVIIAKHEDKTFLHKIRQQGFQNIIEIEPNKEEFAAGPLKIRTFVPRLFDGSFDSSAMISGAKNSFYFMNDCRLAEDQYLSIRDTYGNVKGCFLNENSVNPYPTCYRFDINDRPQLSTLNELHKMTEKGLNHFEQICRILKPDWVVPYAGNLRFLHEDQFLHNRIFEGLQDRLISKLDSVEFIKWNNLEILDSEGHFILRNLEIPAELEPLQLDRGTETPCGYVSYDEYGKLLKDFFIRNLTRLEGPLSICFQIKHDEGFLNYFFTNSDEKTLQKLDLIVEYNVETMNRILKKEMTFQNAHYAYQFKATVLSDLKSSIYSIHKWH